MTEKSVQVLGDRKIKILATLGLLLTTVIWGSSFVVMKTSMDSITPTYLLAFRFTIAAVGLVVIFWKKLKTVTLVEIKYGSVLGLFLFVSYYFQTYGLKYTTASKNAFITTLYVIIVPFLHWLFNKVRPAKKNIIAAVIAVIGLALLSLKGDLTVNYGDFLTFVCGFLFALHMVFIDRYTAVYSPIKLTVLQMASCSVIAWVVAALSEGPCDFGVFADTGVLMSILYLSCIAGMLCFLLQMVGQTHLSPGTSAILLSFEAVSGLIFSVIFLHEIITVRMLIGCALMFAAAILAEYTPSKKRVAALQDAASTGETGAKGEAARQNTEVIQSLSEVQRERNEDGEIIIHS